MRKIEQQMNNAIAQRVAFSKDNTLVTIVNDGNPYGTRAEVYLHGNHIANYWYQDASVEVNERTLAEWSTVTTKSRLRALGANVTTKRGQTFLNGSLIA
jgi:prepilin-type processing-associated H-X9-DG protein